MSDRSMLLVGMSMENKGTMHYARENNHQVSDSEQCCSKSIEKENMSYNATDSVFDTIHNEFSGISAIDDISGITRNQEREAVSLKENIVLTGNKRKVRKFLVDYSDSEEDNDYSSDDSINDPSFSLQQDDFHISDSDEDQENVSSKPTRWRRRQPLQWKENVTKSRRSMCLPYQNKRKDCPAKYPKEVNCTRCRFGCNDNFTEEERKDICHSYWAMADNKRQKDFLIKSVQSTAPKRRKVDENCASARTVSKAYYLQNTRGRFRVCANFFEKTLCISNGPINTAIRGTGTSGSFQGVDRRGRKAPANKTTDEQLALIKQHIESFPCMESHYVRKSSNKKYLDSKLSVLKMYEMYTKYCEERSVLPVSEFTYRRVFGTCYNLSFFKPKKDQCPICNKYEVADSAQKAVLDLEYSMHIIRKIECNAAKENDKIRCRSDSSFITVNFDLQSVLQLPYSDVSQFYYSRKICVYNLTLYEGDGTNAYCYCWNELNGKRGSNEIGSILLHYIQQLPKNVEEVSLFSDTCGGQNRNQQVAAALMYAIKNTHLKVIEQKFLESGHSHMECDSMHSAIENAKRNRTAFVMNDWVNIFKGARSNRMQSRQSKEKKAEIKGPYKVHVMKFSDFKDLQALASNILRNKKKDEDGNTVSWLKIKCLKFDKSFPNVIFYRYDHISVYKKILVAGRGRPRKDFVELKPAYERVLPISKQKKDDLEKLCKKGLIPEELSNWYKNLPISSDIVDRLPEPNFDKKEDEDY